MNKDTFKQQTSINNMHKDNKIESHIITLEAGQYFGDWGLLEGKLRVASAIAVEDTELFYLDSKVFIKLFGVIYIHIFICRNVLIEPTTNAASFSSELSHHYPKS